MDYYQSKPPFGPSFVEELAKRSLRQPKPAPRVKVTYLAESREEPGGSWRPLVWAQERESMEAALRDIYRAGRDSAGTARRNSPLANGLRIVRIERFATKEVRVVE